MRSEWVSDDTMGFILMALTPSNRLAIEMSLRYGMRIGDVLATRRVDVERGGWTYREQKTGKSRRIRVCRSFQTRLLRQAGRIYCFEGRCDGKKHRTRQAVYKDIRRVAEALRLSAHVSPHSARKVYAVDAFRRYGSIRRVQQLLNHSDEAVTMVYALADEFRNLNKKGKKV